MSDHSKYDQERERRKLEQQRQDALREANRRAKNEQEARKNREALNAFYDAKAKKNQQRRGGKPDTCMVTLVAMAGGTVGAVWLAAEGIRWVL